MKNVALANVTQSNIVILLQPGLYRLNYFRNSYFVIKCSGKDM